LAGQGATVRATIRRIYLFVLIILAAVMVFLLPDFMFSRGPGLAGWKIDKVVVIKSKKRLFLFQGHKAISSYPVALGKSPGPKTAQGDQKTPEGRYENCQLMRASVFYKAILISYPNPQERQKGYTGGAIEIHGLPRLPYGLEHFLGAWIIWWGHTDGCIMLTNRDMDEIVEAVKFPLTVEILP